jgi:crotonobetainyl-CoA:carnitine CoA-transferase CaiB-like acyl-CoA transferase
MIGRDAAESGRRGPLAGVRVLEVASGIAGPFCAKLLGLYGADVLKVERPGLGDGTRRLGPYPGGVPDAEQSGTYRYLNLGKRSVTLDVTRPAAASILDDMIRRTDLVVCGLRPATAERAGLTHARVAALNRKATLVAVTSFGQQGPYRDFHATDAILYGLGGAMHATGHADRYPLRLGPRVAEFQGGAVAAYACALALFKAARTGVGEFVDVSMLEAQAASQDRQASFLMAAQFIGESFGRMNAQVTRARVWPCKDGYIEAGAGAANFNKLLSAIGREDLHGDPLFATPDARQTPESQAVFTGIFLEWLMDHTKYEAWTILQAHDIPSGPVYTAADILADRHFQERGFWTELEVGCRTVRVPERPIKMESAPPLRRGAPRLGEHNDEVYLSELGLDADAVARLRAEGVL